MLDIKYIKNNVGKVEHKIFNHGVRKIHREILFLAGDYPVKLPQCFRVLRGFVV
jgi:hypothetical protein